MSRYRPGNRRVRSGRTTTGIRAPASQVIVAASAICVAGFLTVPAPAHAVPMLPLAPACNEYEFIGDFSLYQTNGWSVNFTSTGSIATGRARAVKPVEGVMNGVISGGITGRHLDFTIRWDNGPRGHYTGDVNENGTAYGFTVDEVNPESTANWEGRVPLGCVKPPAPPPQNPAPQIPAPAPTAAVLGAVTNGPATLQAGLSGTYVVTVSNSGGVKAPVELFIIFAGKLEQTGQIGAQGGFDCQLQPPAAGINAAIRCVQQLEAGAKSDIVVQGVGRTPGGGTLLARIGNNSNQKDVAIT